MILHAFYVGHVGNLVLGEAHILYGPLVSFFPHISLSSLLLLLQIHVIIFFSFLCCTLYSFHNNFANM